MLAVSVRRGRRVIAKDEIAVNDLVLSRGVGGRLVSLSVFISRQFAFALRADGLILSHADRVDRVQSCGRRADC